MAAVAVTVQRGTLRRHLCSLVPTSSQAIKYELAKNHVATSRIAIDDRRPSPELRIQWQ